MTTDKPQIEDVIRIAITGSLGSVRTSTPGVIIDYNAAKQTCTVQVVIKSSHSDGEDGGRTYYLPDPISNCPVHWPSGKGGVYSDTFPLQNGDACLVMVTDRSTDEWKATSPQSSYEPKDPRRFDLTDAFVQPGSRSPADALASSAFDAAARVMAFDFLKMGSASASQWMAIADLILTRLNSIESTLNGHTHTIGVLVVTGVTTGVGVAATTANVTGAAGSAGTTALDDIRSQKVKSE